MVKPTTIDPEINAAVNNAADYSRGVNKLLFHLTLTLIKNRVIDPDSYLGSVRELVSDCDQESHETVPLKVFIEILEKAIAHVESGQPDWLHGVIDGGRDEDSE